MNKNAKLSSPVRIVIGSGKVGLRQNGKHLVLTRGKKNRAKVFCIPEKYVGVEVELVAIIKQ